MTDDPRAQPNTPGATLPELPHELPLDRGLVDELVNRARQGDRLDLREGVLQAIDWSGFAGDDGGPLSPEQRLALEDYYRDKWSDIGPLFLAELLSTEFMTELRARGDMEFSPRLLELGRSDPDLWLEIRQFFRRKEMVTAILAMAHQPSPPAGGDPT
ncbi:MAG: hypothetical protein QM692_01310 [Thermomicrobiales bacterium]